MVTPTAGSSLSPDKFWVRTQFSLSARTSRILSPSILTVPIQPLENHLCDRNGGCRLMPHRVSGINATLISQIRRFRPPTIHAGPDFSTGSNPFHTMRYRQLHDLLYMLAYFIILFSFSFLIFFFVFFFFLFSFW